MARAKDLLCVQCSQTADPSLLHSNSGIRYVLQLKLLSERNALRSTTDREDPALAAKQQGGILIVSQIMVDTNLMQERRRMRGGLSVQSPHV